jgi:ATP-dependent DNA helicase 2 subunit 2
MQTETHSALTSSQRGGTRREAIPSKNQKKQKKRSASHSGSDTELEDNVQMDVNEQPATSASSVPASTTAYESLAMIVGEGATDKRIIGNVHPLFDFQQNIARGDVVTKAVADLGKVIQEMITDSFSSQRFDEAIDCMKAMRETSLKVSWSYPKSFLVHQRVLVRRMRLKRGTRKRSHTFEYLDPYSSDHTGSFET